MNFTIGTIILFLLMGGCMPPRGATSSAVRIVDGHEDPSAADTSAADVDAVKSATGLAKDLTGLGLTPGIFLGQKIKFIPGIQDGPRNPQSNQSISKDDDLMLLIVRGDLSIRTVFGKANFNGQNLASFTAAERRFQRLDDDVKQPKLKDFDPITRRLDSNFFEVTLQERGRESRGHRFCQGKSCLSHKLTRSGGTGEKLHSDHMWISDTGPGQGGQGYVVDPQAPQSSGPGQAVIHYRSLSTDFESPEDHNQRMSTMQGEKNPGDHDQHVVQASTAELRLVAPYSEAEENRLAPRKAPANQGTDQRGTTQRDYPSDGDQQPQEQQLP